MRLTKNYSKFTNLQHTRTAVAYAFVSTLENRYVANYRSYITIIHLSVGG